MPHPILRTSFPVLLALAASTPGVGTAVRAQQFQSSEPMPPSVERPPCITLLLKSERTLTQPALRAAAERAFQRKIPGDRVVASGDFVFVESGVVPVASIAAGPHRLVVHHPPVNRFDDREAAAAMTRDPALAAAIRDHGSYLTIAAKSDVSSAERLRVATHGVARLAAELLGDDVLAAAFDENHAFTVVTTTTADALRSDDPVAALTPMRRTIGIVMTSTTKLPGALRLRSALAALSEGDRVSVRAMRQAATLVATVRGIPFQVRMRPDLGPYAAAAKTDHPRGRGLVYVHAWLDTSTPEKTAQERALLGTVMDGVIDAFGDDEALAFTFAVPDAPMVHIDERAMLKTEDPVDAVQRFGKDPITSFADSDPAMNDAMARARATFAEFERHRAAGTGSAFVKLPIREGDQVEHLWIAVTAVEGDRIRGTIANDPVLLKRVRSGAAHECRVAEISDWLVTIGDKRHGGFTIDVIDARERQRRAGGK